jgi:hypothetical protein
MVFLEKIVEPIRRIFQPLNRIKSIQLLSATEIFQKNITISDWMNLSA